jgi:DNA-directed RNA polymerase subunit E'/Rpb7
MKFGRKGGPLLGEFNVTLTVKLLKQDVGRETRHWILGHEPITSVDFKIRREIRLRVIEERDVSSKRSIKMNLHANENEKNTYA